MPEKAPGASPDGDARASAFAALRRRASDLKAPLFAMWELTYRCPLECRHCYVAARREGAELGRDEARALLEDMADLGVLFLVLTGGEPLARDDVFDIIDRARALGFAWKLFTSGLPVDEETARRLADRAPLEIGVSVHGLERAHESVTGVRGSFRAALGAVERLRGRGVPVAVKMSVTPQGLADFHELRSICSALGAKLSASVRLFPAPDAETTAPDEALVLSDEEVAFFHTHCAAGAPPFDETGGTCDAGRVSFAVSPSGDIRPCVVFDSVAGNVRERPLREIWRSEKMEDIRRLMLGERTQCAGCEDRAYCMYCPGLAHAETGSPAGAPPTVCREAGILRKLAEGGRSMSGPT